MSDLFIEDGVEHAIVIEDHSSSGLGCIQRDLKVAHADLTAELHSSSMMMQSSYVVAVKDCVNANNSVSCKLYP